MRKVIEFNMFEDNDLFETYNKAPEMQTAISDYLNALKYKSKIDDNWVDCYELAKEFLGEYML